MIPHLYVNSSVFPDLRRLHLSAIRLHHSTWNEWLKTIINSSRTLKSWYITPLFHRVMNSIIVGENPTCVHNSTTHAPHNIQREAVRQTQTYSTHLLCKAAAKHIISYPYVSITNARLQARSGSIMCVTSWTLNKRTLTPASLRIALKMPYII